MASRNLMREKLDGFKFRVFGNLEVIDHAGNVIALPSKGSRNLLAYLLSRHGQTHTRGKLCAVLWTEIQEAQAKRWLSQALWQIKQSLGSDAMSKRLISSNQGISFRFLQHDEFDQMKFEDSLAFGTDNTVDDLAKRITALQTAINVYRDEYLVDVYDDWALECRQELQLRHLKALQKLFSLQLGHGDLEDALESANRLLRLDPFREEMHREVMLLHMQRGQPAKALAHYGELLRVLEHEQMGLPTTATQELRQRILNAENNDKLIESGELPLPFVGRTLERLWLTQRLERLARQGRGGLVLIEGEAGLGKTRLLQELVIEAAWQKIEVLSGMTQTARPLEAYGQIRQAMEGAITAIRSELLTERLDLVWLAQAARVLTIPGVIPSNNEQLEAAQGAERLRSALCRVIAALSDIAPQVLVLDDLQLTDDATLELIPNLIRSLRDKPVLILIGFRPDEARVRNPVRSVLKALEGEPQLLRVRLQALSLEVSTELAQSQNGDTINSKLIEKAIIEARGNPFYLLELLRSLGTQPHGHMVNDLPLPESIRVHLRERISHLEPKTRLVLSAVAILDADARVTALVDCLDQTRSQVLHSLDLLVRYGWVRVDVQRVVLLHDLLREVTDEQLSRDEQQNLHLRAANFLAKDNSISVATLALHFEQGGNLEQALDYHQLAALNAGRVQAYGVALEHCDRAVAISRQAATRLIETLEIRSDFLAAVGRREQLLADIDELRNLHDPKSARQVQLASQRARALLMLGRHKEAKQAAEDALVEATRFESPALRAAAITVLGQVAMRLGQVMDALAYRQDALAAFEAADDVTGQAEAHYLLGNTQIAIQDLVASQQSLIRASQLYRSVTHLKGQADALAKLGVVWTMLGHPIRAHACYDQALKRSRSLGDVPSQASALRNLASLQHGSGHLAKARLNYLAAISLYEMLGDLNSEHQSRVNLGILLALDFGDADAALSQVHQSAEYFRTLGHHDFIALIEYIYAVAEEQQGHLEAASDRLQNVMGWSLSPSIELDLRCALIRCYLQSGNLAAAEALVENTAEIRHESESSTMLNFQLVLIEIALTRDHFAEAHHRLETHRDAFRKGNYFLANFYHLEYRICLANEQHSEARNAIQKAFKVQLQRLEDCLPNEIEHAMARVPEAKLISKAWKALNIETQIIRLPRSSAPTGRPLRDDEWVEVQWTISSPEDALVSDKVLRRQVRLKRLVREARDQLAAPTLMDLALALQSSPTTIKRDLAALRFNDDVLETRGSRQRTEGSLLEIP
jgi:DNA-binding SARP family transcriptional activator/archaellum biogenesis ATPase FlaH